MEFCVGDRVRHRVFGIGNVVLIRDNGNYGVKFEETNSIFHDLGGRCECGYGHWCFPQNLTLVDEEAKINETDFCPCFMKM